MADRLRVDLDGLAASAGRLRSIKDRMDRTGNLV
jgi:hypothetical protein